LFLIVNPSQNELSRAAARNPELLKQLLSNNFLAIVSCFALLSAKTSISRELAAPRAKETI
jgi:hypothetical protein